MSLNLPVHPPILPKGRVAWSFHHEGASVSSVLKAGRSRDRVDLHRSMGTALVVLFLSFLLCGCGSIPSSLKAFDAMLALPEEGGAMGTLLYQPIDFPREGPGEGSEELTAVSEHVRMMGEAESEDEIRACSLRLILVFCRDPWDYNRLLALKALGRILDRIGPGSLPEVGRRSTFLSFPDLGPEFRRTLAGQAANGEWKALRSQIGKLYLLALWNGPVALPGKGEDELVPWNTSRPLMREGVHKFLYFWGRDGLRLALQMVSRQIRERGLLEVVPTLLALCGRLSPKEARWGGGQRSIFYFLKEFIRSNPVPDPELASLEMAAMHAICRILGIPPRYDRGWFRTWWEEERVRIKEAQG